MGDSSLVCVWVYGSRMEADLAKSLLDAAGIPALSEADTAGGMREHLAWSGAGFKIVVREEDAARSYRPMEPVYIKDPRSSLSRSRAPS